MARNSSSTLEDPVVERGSTEAASRIVERLLGGFDGSFALRLWNGVTHYFGPGSPEFTFVFHDPGTLREMVLRRSPLPLADAYFRGRADIEGDLYAVLRLKTHFQQMSLTARERAGLLVDALRLAFATPNGEAADVGSLRPTHAFGRDHTPDSDREAITHHYDVSNEFYRLFLDERMVYSCAYFRATGNSLDQAQADKLDHVCRKLRLREGERLLDIGCGWGALVIWAARHYGVHAHGITLSERQLELARERIEREGLSDRVKVELRDYRALEGVGVYDKASSIGMLEHVGLSNLLNYHEVVHRVLKPNGLFLNHGITHATDGWQPRAVESQFINRYVFPDGELDTVSNVQRSMERARFEIHDVENLRPHYAMTLRHWVQRLEANHEEALRHVNEATYRVWRVYMAACALEFEGGGTSIHQILASRRPDHEPYRSPVPLTRSDLYEPRKSC